MQKDKVISKLRKKYFCFLKETYKEGIGSNRYKAVVKCNLPNTNSGRAKEEQRQEYLGAETVERAHFPSGLRQRVKLSR